MKKNIPPTKWVADKYECVFPFGKWKGYTIRYVVDIDPSYILWCDENKIVEFSDEIWDNAKKNDEKFREEYWRHFSNYGRPSRNYYQDDIDWLLFDEPF